METLRGATNTIEIWVDAMGYGAFSAPEQFLKYDSELQKKGDELRKKGGRVKIHYYDRDTSLAARIRQFQPDAENLYVNQPPVAEQKSAKRSRFADFREEPAFKEFSKRLTTEEVTVAENWNGFFTVLEERDRHIEDNLRFHKVEVSRFKGLQPILVWMVDWNPPALGGQAMFSVINLRGGETAFLTRDPSFAQCPGHDRQIVREGRVSRGDRLKAPVPNRGGGPGFFDN